MKLSILIPVYNEEETLSELIKRVKKAPVPKGVSKEIIVINDASTDSSKKILEKTKGILLIEHTKNKGKGAAIRTGIKKASGEILLIQDADLEYNPKDYSKLLQPILSKKKDIVYGSRLMNYPLKIRGPEKTPLPFHLVANKALTFFTNVLYGSHLTDMETCYKVFTRKSLSGIKLVSDHFEIEPELTAKFLKKGLEIYEVPIQVTPRGYNEGKKIGWIDGFQAIYALIRFRF